MKCNFLLCALVSVCVWGMTSCIKDEPLYREADIVSFKVDVESFVSANISENRVLLIIHDTEVYKNMTPVIEVSPGATISPESGVALDFTKNVVYKVTSEDGNFSKEYTVSVLPALSYVYDFEEWTEEGTVHKYPALDDIGWSSANPGIALAKLGNVELYPTRSTTDAVKGKYAAMLETQAGGEYFGNKVPIFSGSLFRGEFAIDMSDFVKSTKFGQPHPKENGKPVLFTGYYKYTPGKVFIDSKGNEVPGRIDECSINAVLYRVTKGEEGRKEYLDGTNVYDSEKVVAHAQLSDRTAKSEFVEFSIPFVYEEEINYDLYDYKFAVILASSARGNYYEGAPGSILIVDDVEVVCDVIK